MFQKRKAKESDTQDASQQTLDAALKRLTQAAPSAMPEALFDAAPLISATEDLAQAMHLVRIIRGLLRDVAGPVRAAAHEDNVAARALFAEEYDDARQLFDDQCASSRLTCLIGPVADPIVVPLGEISTYRVAPLVIGIDGDGFTLPVPKTAFADPSEVAETMAALLSMFERLDQAARRFANDFDFLTGRLSREGIDPLKALSSGRYDGDSDDLADDPFGDVHPLDEEPDLV